MPLYPATIFQGENDGEGINLVMYYKLSENYSKELPPHFRENISVRQNKASCFLIFYESENVVPVTFFLKRRLSPAVALSVCI